MLPALAILLSWPVSCYLSALCVLNLIAFLYKPYKGFNSLIHLRCLFSLVLTQSCLSISLIMNVNKLSTYASWISGSSQLLGSLFIYWDWTHLSSQVTVHTKQIIHNQKPDRQIRFITRWKNRGQQGLWATNHQKGWGWM